MEHSLDSNFGNPTPPPIHGIDTEQKTPVLPMHFHEIDTLSPEDVAKFAAEAISKITTGSFTPPGDVDIQTFRENLDYARQKCIEQDYIGVGKAKELARVVRAIDSSMKSN
jgi:hypothetical protein